MNKVKGLLITIASLTVATGIAFTSKSFNENSVAYANNVPWTVSRQSLSNFMTAQSSFLTRNKWKISNPSSPPKISENAALANMMKNIKIPNTVTSVTAAYVDMTNPTFVMQPARVSGDPHFKNGFTDIPVWVITLNGLNLASNGGPSSPQTVSHQLNVMIDATTGEYLGAYSFK